MISRSKSCKNSECGTGKYTIPFCSEHNTDCQLSVINYQLSNINYKGTIIFNEPMKKHTSFRVGGPAEIFVAPETVDDTIKIIIWAKQKNIPCLTVGGGTNLLVKDEGIPGIVMVLTNIKEDITVERNNLDIVVTLTAGTKLQTLCHFAIKNGFAGLNFALGIPGTVGGAICMNAGTSIGSMEDIIHSVTVIISNGQIKEIRKEDIFFSYRQLRWADASLNDTSPVIIKCTLNLKYSGACNTGFTDLKQKDLNKNDLNQEDLNLTESGQLNLKNNLKTEADKIIKNRKKSQPAGTYSAGCFFKNPCFGENTKMNKTAGELIDLAGLKGATIGGAKISRHHANFIVNNGDATASNILALKTKVQKRVNNMFGIKLQPEVKILGGHQNA